MQQKLEGVKLLDVVIARKENVGKSGFLFKVPWYQMEHKSPKDTEVGTFLHIYFSIMHEYIHINECPRGIQERSFE